MKKAVVVLGLVAVWLAAYVGMAVAQSPGQPTLTHTNWTYNPTTHIATWKLRITNPGVAAMATISVSGDPQLTFASANQACAPALPQTNTATCMAPAQPANLEIEVNQLVGGECAARSFSFRVLTLTLTGQQAITTQAGNAYLDTATSQQTTATIPGDQAACNSQSTQTGASAALIAAQQAALQNLQSQQNTQQTQTTQTTQDQAAAALQAQQQAAAQALLAQIYGQAGGQYGASTTLTQDQAALAAQQAAAQAAAQQQASQQAQAAQQSATPVPQQSQSQALQAQLAQQAQLQQQQQSASALTQQSGGTSQLAGIRPPSTGDAGLAGERTSGGVLALVVAGVAFELSALSASFLGRVRAAIRRP